MPDARSWLIRAASFLHQRFWWTRAVTLGVRAIVLDGDRVFLVRHTYMSGWYFPGGGVDRGETAEAAAVRELREESGLIAEERPTLLGLYRNGRRDHVACYIIRQVSRRPTRAPDWEIAETGFFPLEALPEDTSPATRTRLAEALEGRPLSATW